MNYYNTQRPHSGRYCFGKTPMQTFLDSKHIALDKQALGMFQPMLPVPVQLADGLAGQGSNAEQPDRHSRPWRDGPPITLGLSTRRLSLSSDNHNQSDNLNHDICLVSVSVVTCTP